MSRRIRFPNAYGNDATYVINMEHISEFRKGAYKTSDDTKSDLGEKDVSYLLYIQK